MSIYKCLVNGSVDDDTRTAIRDGLVRINRERFDVGADAVRVEFTEVAEGRWYTGGQLSQASMVLGTVPPGTDQSIREAVMDEIAHLFSSVTNTEYHDVMVVAADEKGER